MKIQLLLPAFIACSVSLSAQSFTKVYGDGCAQSVNAFDDGHVIVAMSSKIACNREIISGEIEGTNSLDTQNLPAGIYQLVVFNTDSKIFRSGSFVVTGTRYFVSQIGE